MAYTTNINGVNITIDPFRPITTGPGNQPADFDAGTGTTSLFKPKKITITFDVGVSTFGVEIIGATTTGNSIAGFDKDGKQIVFAQAAYDPQAAAMVSRVQINAPDNTELRFVQILPEDDGNIAYRNLQVVPSPPQSPAQRESGQIITRLPIEPRVEIKTPLVESKVQNAVQFLKITQSPKQREYTKDSMAALPSETISFENTSDAVYLTVGLRSVRAISFDPPAFELPPKGKASVTLNFNTVEINSLEEGRVTLNSVATVTAKEVPIVIITPVKPDEPIKQEKEKDKKVLQKKSDQQKDIDENLGIGPDEELTVDDSPDLSITDG